MTLIDVFVIYLAAGAPFGAFYFLTHRAERGLTARLWLRSIVVWLGWIVYAATLARQEFALAQKAVDRSLARAEKEVEILKQSLQVNFVELAADRIAPSFFEFRETLERYAGLTLNVRAANLEQPASERESAIFLIAGQTKNEMKLAARCVRRKNLARLKVHQTRARTDLATAVKQLFAGLGEQPTFRAAELGDASGEKCRQAFQINLQRLAQILNDAEAVRLFRDAAQIAPPVNQTANSSRTNDSAEKELWKTQTAAASFPVWQAKPASARATTGSD